MKFFIIRLCLMSIALVAYSHTYAQTASGSYLKKRVYRVIDMNEKEPLKTNHLKPINSDSLLVHMIQAAIMSGKVTAYIPTEPLFTTKLTRDQLLEMTYAKVDTLVVVDPVTGKELMQKRITEFDYTKVQQYRVLEDWTFDQLAGKTEIQIVGLGLVRDVYGDNNLFSRPSKMVVKQNW